MYSPNMGLAFGSPAALSRQNFLSSSNIEPIKKLNDELALEL